MNKKIKIIKVNIMNKKIILKNKKNKLMHKILKLININKK